VSYATAPVPGGDETVIIDPTGRTHRVRRLHGTGVFVRELANGASEVVQYHPDGRCLARIVERYPFTAYSAA
jgi:hypothetical protein